MRNLYGTAGLIYKYSAYLFFSSRYNEKETPWCPCGWCWHADSSPVRRWARVYNMFISISRWRRPRGDGIMCKSDNWDHYLRRPCVLSTYIARRIRISLIRDAELFFSRSRKAHSRREKFILYISNFAQPLTNRPVLNLLLTCKWRKCFCLEISPMSETYEKERIVMIVPERNIQGRKNIYASSISLQIFSYNLPESPLPITNR